MSPWKAMPGPATKTAGTATAGRVGFSHGPLVGYNGAVGGGCV